MNPCKPSLPGDGPLRDLLNPARNPPSQDLPVHRLLARTSFHVLIMMVEWV
jgi:hypothetical protein